MVINENFFDDIDNIEMVGDSVEQKQYTHHISIICNMYKLSTNKEKSRGY